MIKSLQFTIKCSREIICIFNKNAKNIICIFIYGEEIKYFLKMNK